jgi:hypothetical protein
MVLPKRDDAVCVQRYIKRKRDELFRNVTKICGVA